MIGVSGWYLYELVKFFKEPLQRITDTTYGALKIDVIILLLLRIRLNLSFRSMVPLVGYNSSKIHRIYKKALYECGTLAAPEIRFPSHKIRMSRAKWIWNVDSYSHDNIPITWIVDGWNQYIYQPIDNDLKNGCYSAKVGGNAIKKLIFTDPYGAPLFCSPSFNGRPHDLQVAKFPELKSFFETLDNETKKTGEYGLGDNAFYGIKQNIIQNFIYTPRLDSQQNYYVANYLGKVRHSVENINASIESFKILRDQFKKSPTSSMDALLKEHHHITLLVLFIIRETQHQTPFNRLNKPPLMSDISKT